MSKYTALLNQFIEDEYDAQLKLRRQLWKQSIAKRVATGLAIGDITIVDFDRESATLKLAENLSRFTVGDRLRLSQDDPDGDYVVCLVDAETHDTLTVSPGSLQSFRKLKKTSGWTLDVDVDDHRQPYIAAIDALDAGKMSGMRLVTDLLNGVKPESDMSRDVQARTRVARIPFDIKQREAVVRSLTTQNYWAVQGAPTTGKTYCLTQLAVTLAREGRRVLITGPDDFCVNHALRCIHEMTGHSPLCKIGSPNRTEGLGAAAGSVRIFETFTTSALHPTDRGLIIGALPTTPQHDTSLSAVEFDTVIVDDGEQVNLPEAICILLNGRRCVVFGDPAGIPPVLYAKHRQPVVALSLYEYLASLAPGTSLDMSYALNESLIDFPNKNFYKRRLRAAPPVAKRQLALQVKPPWPKFQEILHPTHGAVFVETAHQGNHVTSPDEARVAAWIAVVVTLGCGLPPEQVAVISPYRAQARMARAESELLAKSRDEQLPGEILFGTPEDMRHETRDLVVVSLATSDFKQALARGDDVFSLDRLNLALTRANVKRIVVGSPYLMAAKPPLQIADWLTRIRQLYEESHYVSLKVKPTVLKPRKKSTGSLVRKISR